MEAVAERLQAHVQARYQGQLLQDESLARFTAARLGGKADWLYVAKQSTDELVDVVSYAWKHDIPVRVIGGGANILVSDSGVRGLIVVNRVSDIQKDEWHDGRNLAVTSGTSLTHLARRCQALGLSGMEWAISVPGTFGGAVVNNAGAHGGTMADSIADVVVFERGGAKIYTRDELEYDYRTSMLKRRKDRQFLVLLATLCLRPDDPGAIQQRMDEYSSYRKRTQPQGASLGSIFKNPDGDFAGRLIEAAGLKGYRIGGVQVSPVHANFFINVDGKGAAGDYYALIRHVQKAVQEHSGVILEPEIEFLGEF